MKSSRITRIPLRRWLHAARKQGPLLRTVSLGVYLPLTLVYTVLALYDAGLLARLLRDANSVVNTGYFYQGALSSLGVLFWWAAAVISAFASVLIGRTSKRHGKERSSGAFLRYFAVFTGLLALDDLFMLHEEAFPNYLGVPETAVYACYGLLTLGFVRFIPSIYRTEFTLFALGLGFFALSVLTDFGTLRFLFGLSGGASLVVEDLSKALGIVSWFGYALRTGLTEARRSLHVAAPETASTPPHHRPVRPPLTKILN